MTSIIVFFLVAASLHSGNSSNTTAKPADYIPIDTSGTTPPSNSDQSNSTPPPATPTRQVTGKATTIGAGTFTGGKDVAVGLYDVTTTSGQRGNFIVNGTDSYNEILGSTDYSMGVPKIRVQISDGDQIQISGLSQVTFTPVTTPFTTTYKTTTLYAGTFTVGQDIGAGRYIATPGAGQRGNFIVNGNDSYNEILGVSDGMGVPNLTVNLSDGDVIAISSLSQVTLTPTQ